jgi:hypothetical protein
MTVYALQKLRASTINLLQAQLVRKGTDESVNNASTGTTLQDDNELFLTLNANTTYALSIAILAIEAAGTGIDIKMAWTQPSGATLDLATAAPHTAWNASSAALETEWASWSGETGTTTSSINFGTTNSAKFGYHFEGSITLGANSGLLRLQWAQVNLSASNLTVKAGSRMWAQPVAA